MTLSQAPELQTVHWFNTDAPISLEELRGRVVLIEAFQMLCPGCVSHGLPQATRVSETFNRDEVVVLGLHTVFEHHAAQGTREALEAFLHEYRITFPVGIDKPSATGEIPETMAAYRMRGTPTLILIDRRGRLRNQYFGQVPDLALGAEIMALVQENGEADVRKPEVDESSARCNDDGCAVRYEEPDRRPAP